MQRVVINGEATHKDGNQLDLIWTTLGINKSLMIEVGGVFDHSILVAELVL